jgi:hypothetical protein
VKTKDKESKRKNGTQEETSRRRGGKKRSNFMRKNPIYLFFGILLLFTLKTFAISDSNWVILFSPDCKSAINQRYHPFMKNGGFKIFRLNDTTCNSIEKLLPAYFELCNKNKVNSHNCDYYYRQYIGFVFKGNQYVYINLFAKHNKIDYWRNSPVWVMDGGDSFCGIIFNLKTNDFLEIACNGHA